jgi:hypothetical protein
VFVVRLSGREGRIGKDGEIAGFGGHHVMRWLPSFCGRRRFRLTSRIKTQSSLTQQHSHTSATAGLPTVKTSSKLTQEPKVGTATLENCTVD